MIEMFGYFVYALFDPRDNGVRYIGRGVGRRLNWIRYPKSTNQYGVHPWLIELKRQGLSPIVTKVLEGLTKEQTARWEKDLIDFIGRAVSGTGPLLNISTGGESGSAGRPVTEETRRKCRKCREGLKHSRKSLQKMSIAKKGKKASAATCQKMSKSRKGKPHNASHLKNLRDALQSDAYRKKMSKIKKGKWNGKGKKPEND